VEKDFIRPRFISPANLLPNALTVCQELRKQLWRLKRGAAIIFAKAFEQIMATLFVAS